MSMQNDFNAAINFAIDEADDCKLFLEAWCEGDWETLEREWPEFKVSDELKNPQVRSPVNQIVSEGSTVLMIDDINVSFHNNVITLELINGHDHIEYSVDFAMIKSRLNTSNAPLMNERDTLSSKICTAIEVAFRECKSMILRGHK